MGPFSFSALVTCTKARDAIGKEILDFVCLCGQAVGDCSGMPILPMLRHTRGEQALQSTFHLKSLGSMRVTTEKSHGWFCQCSSYPTERLACWSGPRQKARLIIAWPFFQTVTLSEKGSHFHGFCVNMAPEDCVLRTPPPPPNSCIYRSV